MSRPEPRRAITHKSARPRRMLDLAVETALVGATVALELGDEFGLVTYADGAKILVTRGKRSISISSIPRLSAEYRAIANECRLRSVVQRNSSAPEAARLPGVAGGPGGAVGFRLVAPRSWPSPLHPCPFR